MCPRAVKSVAILGSVFACLVASSVGRADVLTTSENVPPPGGWYENTDQWTALYANGIVLYGGSTISAFSQSFPPPATIGLTVTHSLGSTLTGVYSTDNGMTTQPFSAPASMTFSLTYDGATGNTRKFGAELLQLDFSGGTLPWFLAFRESPTLASLGRTNITDNGDGTYRISSFFDIFTEVTTDGGASWTPSQAAAHEVLVPEPCSVVLLAIGSVGVIGRTWRRRRTG